MEAGQEGKGKEFSLLDQNLKDNTHELQIQGIAHQINLTNLSILKEAY